MVFKIKNNIIRNIFILILLLVLLLGFSKSYISYSIDNLAFVTAIGIDLSDSDKTKLNVVFQFSTTPKSSESDSKNSSIQSKSTIASVEASSIDSAINLMNSHMGKELKLSHCKLIIFSEEIAKRGISDEIYSLVNNIQVRPAANLVVSKCNTEYYIKNSNPSLENYVSKYYEIFPDSGKYTGYTTNATIGSFFHSLSANTCEGYAILGGVSSERDLNFKDTATLKSGNTSIKADRKAENIGLAVFKNDNLVGELTALETLSFSILRNDINTFMVSIPRPENSNEFLDIYLYASMPPSFNVDIVNNTPYIKVDIQLNGGISTSSYNTNYLNSDYLEKISLYTNSYLESIISNYLFKTSKDFESDICCIGKYALSKFNTWHDYESYNWKEKYKDAFFEVNVNSNIKSGHLINQT